ncbi:MAG: hypothetical protein KGZ43_11280, partial [Sulfuritalea sp.]|nr:hypothetical protein [Sulfuritalea sp.]
MQMMEPKLIVDAGVGHFRLLGLDAAGARLFDATFPSSRPFAEIAAEFRLREHFGAALPDRALITGKLAPFVRNGLAGGRTILPAAGAWMAAKLLVADRLDPEAHSLAIVELSASGYLLAGVDREGKLKDDLLVVNPRCGAGAGINLDRVLQKLGLARADVDVLLAEYLGEAGRERRAKITVRADRCGVFSSSATISDKNQGIPLDMALATTLKSEVLKACRRLPAGFDAVCLTGRVFHWRYARDCAEDALRQQGVRQVLWDPDNDVALAALQRLGGKSGRETPARPVARPPQSAAEDVFPDFPSLKAGYEADRRFLRLPDQAAPAAPPELADRPLYLTLDVGSTMAKVVLADSASGAVLFLRAYSNAGDTIQTLQQVFRELREAGHETLRLRGIGITGSARFQVQQALENRYPALAGRVMVLVENYAHARGSIVLAREHVQRLRAAGEADVNADFCVLVDIGGEDTKISTIALREAELFNNAMNLKCSAGTGSLMDTLAAMLGLPGVAQACAEAYAAPRGLAINATCAVFLMENARKLQVQGVSRAEILASANWAIVENMARTLWSQVELPRNTVVLLHGQTMLSDPLPVAVTHRLQSYLGGRTYALVPPHPGHRACFGLVLTLAQTLPDGDVPIRLDTFLESRFEKRIIQCHGAACDDKAACCNRTQLTCRGADGKKALSFTLGGCSAINELLARKKTKAPVQAVRDTYKEIWDYIGARQPRSEDPNRLVIPRSFSVSEWAYLLGRLFVRLGLPVHVDDVRDSDLTDAQPLFNIDTCAPHMGAVGHYRRLAGAPHGIILAPQIEFMPTQGMSIGRTCTLNQGGVAVALNMARLAHGHSRFHLFNLDLSQVEAEALRAQLQGRLAAVFRHYRIDPTAADLSAALAGAIGDHLQLRAEVADLAAAMAQEALDQDVPVALVVGREYILNPGIYDSHVRRLLRDKHMVVLPSYVLDLDLNPDYAHLYWRNPHFIASLFDAVARRELHKRLRHEGLRDAFRRIETGPELLPVVQVSTFCCGPDSVVSPLIAEIMKQRPFLLIQSDAVIKELAHLENRINTYVKQLDLGLHERMRLSDEGPFDVRTLGQLLSDPIDKERDVLYFPTLADNRVLTAVLRGAGFTCIDNYDDDEYSLSRLVRQGRKTTGDAVCAPLAAVWADLERAEADFVRRRAGGDPLVAGKRRLLYFDNKGPGPCRQGQYADMHRLMFQRKAAAGLAAAADDPACPAAPGEPLVKFLIGHEAEGYDIGVEQWVLARAHLGIILHGVLQSLLFTGAPACRDAAEYRRFHADFLALKAEVYRNLESFAGPGRTGRWLMAGAQRLPYLEWVVKYFAYRLYDPGLRRLVRGFARRWIEGRSAPQDAFRIALTGEVYMRASQAEEIFRLLLDQLGFRRFTLEYTPVWNYMEWAFDEVIEVQRDRLERLMSPSGKNDRPDRAIGATRGRIRLARSLQFILRNLMARPLYRAAGLPMPLATRKTLPATREMIPTLRPLGELATYAGEALHELRHGADLILNVAPNGCMVATMGEVLTPAIVAAAGQRGRIQHLFSADGDVDEELLSLALLKALGPERLYEPGAGAPADREARGASRG